MPSTTTSNGRPGSATARLAPIHAHTSATRAGFPDASPSGAWTTTPSQRSARCIERACGQAPTGQTGIRGRWAAPGRSVIGGKR